MNRAGLRTAIAALAAIIALPFLLAAAPNSPPARAGAEAVAFTATLADLGGRASRQGTLPVKIWVDRLTSDEEAAGLADLVRAEGAPALERALFGATVGRLQIGDRLGYPIAFARRFVDEQGEHLLLIAQRPISFREIFRGTRSHDYPFTVVELDLDAHGRGSGEVLSAARVLTHEDGGVEIRNLEVVAARLLAVKPVTS